jgi:hypothetical protein
VHLDYDRLNLLWGPWVSLLLGVAAVAVVRRGILFAPVAVAFLVLAWTIAAVAERLLAPPPAPSADGAVPDPESAFRRLARTAAGTLMVGLYQNVLFYLVPVWAASATWTSANAAFPVLLAGMAVFSCFEYPYRRLVTDRPAVRALWTSVILFAALVPAAAGRVDLPTRAYLSLGAAAAAIAAAAVLLPARSLRSWGGPVVIACTLLAAGLAWVAGPLLPPVPIVCVDSGTGTGLSDRNLTGLGDTFPPGTDRVYAWFAVSSPPEQREEIEFRTYRDGEPVGQPLVGAVTGGRKQGFRTWTFARAPRPGAWRVDLVTSSGQLVCRERFRVEAPPTAPREP